MPRPIAINGRFLSQTTTGVQRYAFEVVRGIDSMLAAGQLEPPAQQVEILAPPGTPDTFRPLAMRLQRVGQGSGQVWEQLQLPLYCRGKLLFTPAGGAPLLHRRHVFTMHDAGVFATPEAYSPRYGTWYRWHHRRAARMRQLYLLTVSEASKKELVRWLKLDPKRVEVTPLGHEHVFEVSSAPGVLRRLGLLPRAYVLAVGSAHPNKNFSRLLKAFAQLRLRDGLTRSPELKLVVAGGVNSRVFTPSIPQPEWVVRTGYVTDAELRALYEEAGCFAFPSLYEGFGLPPLEAMALGCPVACSNATSLPEVCGDAAVYFNPQRSDSIADAMETLLGDASLRAQMVERGIARSRMFQWQKTASLTWAILLKRARR